MDVKFQGIVDFFQKLSEEAVLFQIGCEMNNLIGTLFICPCFRFVRLVMCLGFAAYDKQTCTG